MAITKGGVYYDLDESNFEFTYVIQTKYLMKLLKSGKVKMKKRKVNKCLK